MWKNRERRKEIEEELKTRVALGVLQPILTLLEDPPGHAADLEGHRQAVETIARLDAELLRIEAGSAYRASAAARMGQEIAAGIGLAGIAATLILAALG